MKYTLSALVLLTCSATSMAPVFADGGEWSSSSPLAPYQKLIEKGDYQQALVELEAALEQAPEDADLLNLTAYSHRQLERYDTALEYYQRALKIEPEHRGANEYLGELYLQLEMPEKAEERLEVLDKECFFGCKEFDELQQAIREYRVQNPPEG